MLVVLSDERDAGALELVQRWADQDARLLTSRDLCSPGWRYHAPGAAEDCAVIAGVAVPVRSITGVVTRIPLVRAQDLPQIAEPDREYVAAEHNAFLTAWLDGLACPVLNRPSATSLMGPALSHERWLMTAARAGLPLATRQYHAPERHRPFAPAIASVVGDRWFGAVAPELGQHARRLARCAGVELLTARFSAPSPEGVFWSADLGVEVTPEIADALLDRLRQLEVECRT